MNFQNPRPRSTAELHAMLDARMKGEDVLKLLTVIPTEKFNVRRAAEKIAKELATAERFGDGYVD